MSESNEGGKDGVRNSWIGATFPSLNGGLLKSCFSSVSDCDGKGVEG